MNVQFKKAVKQQLKARIALDGPSGSGKTYSALIAATVLAQGEPIAVIDTERGSASLYADKFAFDVLELKTFDPRLYIEAIEAAEKAGYSVIVIDSLSHAWEGEGGALDLVDQAAKRQQGNSYTAWKDVTPIQRKLVDTMLQSSCHIIATMRSKMEYSQEKDEKTGKTTIRKVGMAPIQRQGMEYEFTVVGDMDIDHNLVISKTRCEPLTDVVVNRPGPALWEKFLAWLNSGEAAPAEEMKEEATKPEKGHTLDGGKEEYHAGPIPNGRPWAPEKLREVVLERVGKYRSRSDNWLSPPPDGLRGAMVGALDKVLGDADRRHTFLRVLFGDPSSKSLDHAQVKVVMEWLDKSDPAIATDEAHRLVNAEIQADMKPML